MPLLATALLVAFDPVPRLDLIGANVVRFQRYYGQIAIALVTTAYSYVLYGRVA